MIAESFARIFYRNAINIGLPILECREAAEMTREGDELEIDFARGLVRNATRDADYHAQPFPPFIEEIIRAGGLVESIKRKTKRPKGRKASS